MSIVVSGTLVDPMGVVEEEATIKVVVLSSSVSVRGSEAKSLTDSGGLYSFNLVEGDHMIEINTTDEYKLTGDVRVTSGMVNASYTLPELLTDYLVPAV